MKKLFSLLFLAALLAADVMFGLSLLAQNQVGAVTIYPPAALLQPGDITSSHIKDGTIVNADIAGGAAIATSKIASTTTFVALNVQVASGTQSAPGIFFSTETTTGMYWVGTNQLGMVVGATEVARLVNAATPRFQLGAGLLSFGSAIGGLDTSMGRNAAGVMEFNNGTLGAYRDIQVRAINPSSGNVGIGTTSTPSLLTVNGTIETKSGGVKYPDGTTQTSATQISITYSAYPSGTIAINTPVFGYTDYQNLNTTSTGLSFGLTTTSTNMSVSREIGIPTRFASTSEPVTVTVRLAKQTVPTDNAIVSLRPDFNGMPSSTILASSSLAGGSISGSLANYTMTFNVTSTNTAGTQYWLTFHRSGAYDDTNYFYVDCGSTAAGTFAAPIVSFSAGTTWFKPSYVGSCYFDFNLNYITFDQTSATSTFSSNGFLGFTTTSTSVGTISPVQIAGTVSTSSLTAGSRYYLSNTAGTLSTTPGTNSRTAGVALSTSTLLIVNQF